MNYLSSIQFDRLSHRSCISLPQIALNQRFSYSNMESATPPFVPELALIEVRQGEEQPLPTHTIRIGAWNLEQGRNWQLALEMLTQEPDLQSLDILLLTEVDVGCKRSGYTHVPQQLAKGLGLSYLYGIEFLEGAELMTQRFGALDPAQDMSYHGNAILSRYPLQDPFLLRFPGGEKWWQSQGRMGGRMALGATITLSSGAEVVLFSTHLESGITPEDFKVRRQQIGMLGRYLWDHVGDKPVIIGGDLNARPTWPEMQLWEQFGFRLAESNDLSKPTMQRIMDGNLRQMVYHIDYILVKGLQAIPKSAQVIPAIWPRGAGINGYVSDHHLVTVEVKQDRT